MTLPAIRETFTRNSIAFNILLAASSGKLAEEMDRLGGLIPTFGGLDASAIISRVAVEEIMEDTGGINKEVFTQDAYSRNISSLAGDVSNTLSSLVSSITSTVGFGKPNLRNHNLLTAPGRFTSPIGIKQDKRFKKSYHDESLVKLLLLSLGGIGTVVLQYYWIQPTSLCRSSSFGSFLLWCSFTRHKI